MKNSEDAHSQGAVVPPEEARIHAAAADLGGNSPFSHLPEQKTEEPQAKPPQAQKPDLSQFVQSEE